MRKIIFNYFLLIGMVLFMSVFCTNQSTYDFEGTWKISGENTDQTGTLCTVKSAPHMPNNVDVNYEFKSESKVYMSYFDIDFEKQ